MQVRDVTIHYEEFEFAFAIVPNYDCFFVHTAWPFSAQSVAPSGSVFWIEVNTEAKLTDARYRRHPAPEQLVRVAEPSKARPDPAEAAQDAHAEARLHAIALLGAGWTSVARNSPTGLETS
jgi:hypothetical protein